MEIKATSRVNPLLRLLGSVGLWLLGWKAEGRVPDADKWVCIVAPHTSNWDFFHGLLISWVLGIKGNWLGKDSIFRGPVGPLLRALGGIPVDRSRHHGLVEQAVEAFRIQPRMFLVLAPEGTRRRTEYWKSGFYRVAVESGVPLALGYLDYKRRAGGLGPVLTLTGDAEADLARMREFYAGITARHPEDFGEIRFKERG